jgi:small multidrug resistance family-3 protein
VTIARSLALFLAAGLCEIVGGWLVWQSVREGRAAWWGVAGGLLLVLYGLLPTLQPSHFGRVYAAYGGVFIAMSLAWGWWMDGNRPDAPDLIGAMLALAGVGVMMYWPRG